MKKIDEWIDVAGKRRVRYQLDDGSIAMFKFKPEPMEEKEVKEVEKFITERAKLNGTA